MQGSTSYRRGMARYSYLALFALISVLVGVNASCIDKDSRCKGWAGSGECTSNPSYMLKNCRKSCKKCTDECKNKEKNDDCNTWRKSNFCKESSQWYGYMKENCQKSCGFCIVREQTLAAEQDGCADKKPSKDCRIWKNKQYCDKSSKFYRFMSDKCRKTCEFCKKKKAVISSHMNCLDSDTAKDCSTWKDKGYCKASHQYYQYMSKNCNKTCGFCKKEQATNERECVDKETAKDCNIWKKKGYCDASTKYHKFMSQNCKKTCGHCGIADSDCKDAYDTEDCAQWAKQGECGKNPGWMNANCKKSCNKCSSSSKVAAGGSVNIDGASSGSKGKNKDKTVTEINDQYCGLRLKSRVVGGSDAVIGDWPWQVGLARSYNPTKPFCGGSLINRQWIVTANHCFGRAGVSSIKPEQLVIILGEHDISKNDGSEVTIKASKIIRHEDYKLGSYDADIALVKLATPVTYNALIKPVCLPEQNQKEVIGENCYVTGWGRLAEGGKQATVLQEAKLPIVSRKTCSEAFGYVSAITDNMICAGFKEGGIDACQGDSGGPFVCRKGGRFQLTGVVSFGRGCARASLYGVYAKTSKYVNWIKRKIKE